SLHEEVDVLNFKAQQTATKEVDVLNFKDEQTATKGNPNSSRNRVLDSTSDKQQHI
ncbi:hypothetical protein MKW98_007939, partial [Papaver atlanticum]